MDLGLKGRRALVTAASAGLGYAIAEALAAEGATVALCSRELDRAAKAAERIRETTGQPVHAFAADVADSDSLARLFDSVLATLGGLDILVNNAGGPPPGDFLDSTEATWLRGYELTLMSVVRSIKLALPAFEAAGGGRVLTVMSSSVKQVLPNLLLSNVYRPALTGLTKSLAIELGPKNIQVLGIAPGRIATDRIEQLDRAAAERSGKPIEEVRANSVASIPAGRLGQPEEFGRVGAFLCSPAAQYMSGSVVLVDGAAVRAL